MSKKKNEIAMLSESHIGDAQIFECVANIIESRKYRAGVFANCEITLMYWEVGEYINSVVLDGSRAKYGKRIVTELASQLVVKYGKTFDVHNLRRKMRFFKRVFCGDEEIIISLQTLIKEKSINIEKLRFQRKSGFPIL